jgi:hypothetical protein
MSSILRRREIFTAIFIIVSATIMIEFYFGQPKAAVTNLKGWGGILWSWSQLFGAVALILSNIRRIRRRVRGWYWFIVVLISWFFVFGMSFAWPDAYTFYITADIIGRTLNVGMVAYVGVYSLTVFYRGSFGIKSPDVALLMFSIIMGLMLNAPITPVIWDQIPVFGEFLKNVPGSAANSALLIGIALGTIAMYVRAALGYERAYLGG